MNETCIWKEAYQGNGPWESSCGHAWELLEGTPSENSMNFCPFCGKELEEKLFKWKDDDDET